MDATKELELGEVNITFGELLSKINQEQSRLFIKQFKRVKNHSESAPRCIQELRYSQAVT